MKTEPDFFTEIATKEIFCPCGEECDNHTQPVNRTLGKFGHDSFEMLINCISRFVMRFVSQRIKELRTHAEKNLKRPMETFRGIENNNDFTVYKKVVKKLNLQFSSNKLELEALLIRNLFTICQMAVEKAGAAT